MTLETTATPTPHPPIPPPYTGLVSNLDAVLHRVLRLLTRQRPHPPRCAPRSRPREFKPPRHGPSTGCDDSQNTETKDTITMTDDQTETETPRFIDAWTPSQLAAAADTPNITTAEAERLLDTAVAEGYAVRITGAEGTFYVAGDMRTTLETLGTLPVAADEVDAMRSRIYSALAAERARGGRRG